LGRHGRAVVHPAVEAEGFLLIEKDCPRRPVPQVRQQPQTQPHMAPPAPPSLWVSVHVCPLSQASLQPSSRKGVGGHRETTGEARVSKGEIPNVRCRREGSTRQQE